MERLLEVSRVSQGLEGRAEVKSRKRARCCARTRGFIAFNRERKILASKIELVMSPGCQKLECASLCCSSKNRSDFGMSIIRSKAMTDKGFGLHDT